MYRSIFALGERVLLYRGTAILECDKKIDQCLLLPLTFASPQTPTMRQSVTHLVDKLRIPLETTSVVVTKDGSIRTANDGDKADDCLEITATRDMLPIPRDSPMRTWGVFSILGFFVAEGELSFFLRCFRLSCCSIAG